MQQIQGDKHARLMSVLGLGFCSFAMLCSEFMPMGLLSNIAADFRISESQVGIMISIYAVSVAILSVPLTVVTSKIDPKKLMLSLMGIFCVGQLASFLAPSFLFLVAARFVVSAAHAIFWSVTPPLAIKVAGQDLRAKAIAIVATGGTIATIVGVPAGRSLGLAFGWRIAFLSVGIVGALSLAYLLIRFPNDATPDEFPVRRLPKLISNRALLATLAFTFIICAGYYCGYSFIEPVLLQVAHYSNDSVTLILGLYGISGFIGAQIFARCYDSHEHAFWQIAAIVTTLSVGAFWVMSSFGFAMHLPIIMFITIFALGISSVIFNISTQAIVLDCVSQEDSSVATALFSGIYNLGIGAGGALGSVIAAYNMGSIFMAAGLLCAFASAFCVVLCIPQLKKYAYTPRG